MSLAKPNAPKPNAPQQGVRRPRAAKRGAAGPAPPVEDTVMTDTHIYMGMDDMTEDEDEHGPCASKLCAQNLLKLNGHLGMFPRLSKEHKALVQRVWALKMEHADAVEKLKATHKAALEAQKKRLTPTLAEQQLLQLCKRSMRSRRDLKALEVAGMLAQEVAGMLRDLK